MQMQNEITWYQSRGIWNSIVQVVVGIAVSMGLVSSALGVHMQTALPELIIGSINIVQGFVGIYTRTVATAVITSTKE